MHTNNLRDPKIKCCQTISVDNCSIDKSQQIKFTLSQYLLKLSQEM